MILYIDNEGCIKDVGTTSDTSLTPVEVTDGTFEGWSIAKICCFKIHATNGQIDMITPVVDSRLLEHIDQLGKATEAITPYKETKTAYIGDTEVTFYDVPNGNVTVYFNNSYELKRIGDRIEISFDPLEDITEITISVI